MRPEAQSTVSRSIQTLYDAGSATGRATASCWNDFLARQMREARLRLRSARAARPVGLSVCRSVLADSHAAEDAFQATFPILVRQRSLDPSV